MGPTQLKHWKQSESWVPCWAASFSTAHQVGLALGQTFVNPLHQWHEAGSEVSFVPSNPAQTKLNSLVDEYWASSWLAVPAVGHA